jgi:hypothetical protein
MNLKELAPKKITRLNKVMESRFGFALDYDKLTYPKAQRLSIALSEQLSKIRRSYGIHTAERNPKYMEMLMVQEGLNSWLNQHELLTEGELETAEVVLAAKDMVDSVQKMIEDASKMMNEQLPPLLDSIRDQIGTAQADQFKGSVTSALQGLLDNLNIARDALDNGARSLSGEQVDPAMGAEPAVEPELGLEVPPEGSDLDISGEEELDLGGDDLTRARR